MKNKLYESVFEDKNRMLDIACDMLLSYGYCPYHTYNEKVTAFTGKPSNYKYICEDDGIDTTSAVTCIRCIRNSLKFIAEEINKEK